MNKLKLTKLLVTIPLVCSFTFCQVGTALAADGPLNRDQVEEKYKWSIDELYPNSESFNADCKKITEVYIPKIKTFQNKLTSSSKIYECLTLRDEMNRTMEKLYTYSKMKLDENQKNNSASEMASITETLNSKVSAASAFIQPEILSQNEIKIKSYMNDSKLKDYKHLFDMFLKQKPHTLSKSEEEMLASASDIASSPNDIYGKVKSSMKFAKIKDSKGNEVQVTNSSYNTLLENKDRDFRKKAFEETYKVYDQLKDPLASTLTAEVKKNTFFAKSRKYSSSLESSLANEFIPISVYDNLIKSVDNNVDKLHKYVSLRKRVLGVDKVHVYDLYVPIVNSSDAKLPYEDAKKLVANGLGCLGDDYVNTLKKALDDRWVDVYETQDKRSGAYSWGTYDTKPFVLLNYNNNVDSMLTLAHEMGHSMNSYYTHKNQKYVNSNVPIFNAEVASTSNEFLMLKYLAKNAKDDNEKLYYINALLEKIKNTIYNQTMYSEFEKMIHDKIEKGDALSADSLNEIWKSLMEKYYGQDFQTDDLGKLWWARIPHFYMNFYVYKYATSMSASNQLTKNMTEGTEASKKEAIDKYLKFLSAGSEDYPLQTLKNAGVDMRSSAPIDNLLKDFGSLVDEMDQILAKQGK